MVNIDENILRAFQQAINEAAEDELVFDILINNTSVAHWKSFLAFIKNNHAYSFWTFDEADTKNLPADISGFFEEQCGFNIHVSGLHIQCFVDSPGIIDMFIKPEQLNSNHQIKSLLSFLHDIANTINMNVEIHIEAVDAPFITITSTGDLACD